MNFSMVLLIPLPCGCVAEFEQTCSTEEGVVICPWCDSMFITVELQEWLLNTSRPPIVQGQLPVVKVDGKVLEVLERLPCGCPSVRERGGAPFHLDADENDIELLRN